MENNKDKIELLNSISKLKMSIKGVDKNLKGFGYEYQDFNEILKVIKNTIKEQKLQLDFIQKLTYTTLNDTIIRVIETTFFSLITGYEITFSFPIIKEDMEIVTKGQSKLTPPQIIGSIITYFKRYALVSFLSIESEVDTDANIDIEPINTTPKEQIKPKESNKMNINKETKENNKNNEKLPPLTDTHKGILGLLYCENKLLEKNIPKSENIFDKRSVNKFIKEIIDECNITNITKFFNDNEVLKSTEYWEIRLIQYLAMLNKDTKLFLEFCRDNKDKIKDKPSQMFLLMLQNQYFKEIFIDNK